MQRVEEAALYISANYVITVSYSWTNSSVKDKRNEFREWNSINLFLISVTIHRAECRVSHSRVGN